MLRPTKESRFVRSHQQYDGLRAEVSGTVYKLDTAGNSKASDAIKNRADRTDPTKPQPKEIMAKVDGTEKGGLISVDSIAVQ